MRELRRRIGEEREGKEEREEAKREERYNRGSKRGEIKIREVERGRERGGKEKER